ncbi:MAG TPA: phage portal protein [Fuerstia sp.]|nr:phage portal protein [Fuerstiella sp.]
MTSIKDRIQSAFRGLLGVQPPVTAVRPAGIQATFDLAQTTVHNRRHWANADSLAARASMSPAVRAIVRKRSRHEFDNNSWYCGILRTAANHIIGCGPRLQVLTTDHDANTRLEKAWVKWSRQVMLADKLRMMFETYWKDGEVFAMRTSRPSRWPISLDIRTFEAEQCAAPWIGQRLGDPYTDDGIRTDPNNNEIEYHFYDQHPGDVVFTPTLSGKWFPDKDVVHLFRRERPGQVRGIPRATSALNTLPVMRRQEMATLLASETSASFATFLKSTSPAIPSVQSPEDFAELEIAFNMLTTLPQGWDISQVDSKHPGPQYEAFQRQTLTSFCRCTNMPYALAAGTSRDSNFSSNKGDVKNVWEPETKTEQDRIELSVIEQIWSWFLEEAVYVPGLLDGLPSIHEIDHQWYWSPLPNLDEVDSATAAAKRVATGQSTLSKEHANRGTDFDTEVTRAAKDFGVDETTYRTVLFAAIFDRQPAVPFVNTTMSDESVLDDIEDAPGATLAPQTVTEVAI